MKDDRARFVRRCQPENSCALHTCFFAGMHGPSAMQSVPGVLLNFLISRLIKMTFSRKEKKDYLRTTFAFAAVCLVAGSLIWLGNRNDAISEGERLKAGVLTAHQVKAAFQGVGGRILLRPHEESDRIAAGDVIMTLDPTDTDISIRESKASIASLDAQIAELEGSIELALRTADANEAATWRQIEEAEAARRTQSATTEKTKLDYERAVRLHPSGAVSKAALDEAKAAYDAGRASLRAAERAISALAVGADEAAIQKLKKTGRADGMRLSAIENARFEAQNVRNTLANLKASREAAAARLDALLVDKERLTLKSPQSGKILELLFEPGEIVAAGTPVVLLETDRRYVEIYVGENDASRYAPGSSVELAAPAIGSTFEGRVRFCEAAPDFAELRMVRERGQANLTLFKVRIDVPSDVPGLLTGMTVEVRNE